jgi:Kdo2-lipid IVA lauroyltransferase/acyltransferase
MKKTFGYYILLVLTWPMQFFPLAFHFLFADLFYFLIYRVFGYRKKVVTENLRHSFPQMQEMERKQVEKKFYRSFADLFIETLYYNHTPYKKVKKRLVVENLELVHRLLGEGRNVVMLAGHLGNWEYFQLFRTPLDGQKFYVYKQLGNKTFDQFYRRARSRGATPLEMRETYRTLLSVANSESRYVVFTISDQRPLKSELKHWMTFMNQDTPVITGTERIARKTKAAVVFTEFTRIKRGYQKLRFELITEDASKTSEFEITHSFMHKLEESIIAHPDQYFWTHKRWKYKREKN